MVYWDMPTKNPETVDLYRVFWRRVGSRTANKTDTISRKVVLTGLSPGVAYEVVVKAGNSNGTSQLTTPITFIPADQYIIASPKQASDVGGAVGVVIAVIIVIALVVAVVYFLKKRNLIVLSVKKPESPTVSFENPFYSSNQRESGNPMQVTHNCHQSFSSQILHPSFFERRDFTVHIFYGIGGYPCIQIGMIPQDILLKRFSSLRTASLSFHLASDMPMVIPLLNAVLRHQLFCQDLGQQSETLNKIRSSHN